MWRLIADIRLFGGLVRLTVRAGNDHGVAIRVLDPDLAMTRTVALTFRRVSVRCSYDRRVELAGTYDDIVEVSHVAKPQQDASADLDIWAHEEPVVMFDISLMELK